MRDSEAGGRKRAPRAGETSEELNEDKFANLCDFLSLREIKNEQDWSGDCEDMRGCRFGVSPILVIGLLFRSALPLPLAPLRHRRQHTFVIGVTCLLILGFMGRLCVTLLASSRNRVPHRITLHLQPARRIHHRRRHLFRVYYYGLRLHFTQLPPARLTGPKRNIQTRPHYFVYVRTCITTYIIFIHVFISL